MGMVKEFKEFALKGNVLDLAVAVIIGGAFGKIVGSLIDDVIMPVVGLALNKVDFKNLYYPLRFDAKGVDVEAARKLGPVIAYGNFISIVINFIILAFIIFLVVKAFNHAKKRFDKEVPAPAPAGPTAEQKLLTEIRDLLARR